MTLRDELYKYVKEGIHYHEEDDPEELVDDLMMIIGRNLGIIQGLGII